MANTDQVTAEQLIRQSIEVVQPILARAEASLALRSICDPSFDVYVQITRDCTRFIREQNCTLALMEAGAL